MASTTKMLLRQMQKKQKMFGGFTEKQYLCSRFDEKQSRSIR